MFGEPSEDVTVTPSLFQGLYKALGIRVHVWGYSVLQVDLQLTVTDNIISLGILMNHITVRTACKFS